MNRRSSPRTFTTSVWLVGSSRSIRSAAGIDLVRFKRLGGEPAEDVVAHAGTDGRAHAQPRQVDRRVGGAAADVEHQLIDRDQLTGPRQVRNGGAQVVGHDQAGTDDGRGAVDFWRGLRCHSMSRHDGLSIEATISVSRILGCRWAVVQTR